MHHTPTSAHTSVQRVQLEVWPHHTVDSTEINQPQHQEKTGRRVL